MDFIYTKAAEEALALDLKKDKALIINLAYMVILALTLLYDMMAKEGVHTFRIVLAAVTAWIMFFVYKKTFLRRSRISFLFDIYIRICSNVFRKCIRFLYNNSRIR